MARKVFFSFHFANDFWRTQQVRNINALEGQTLATPNAWEEVKRKGDTSIMKWIQDSLVGKSCVVVLVGSATANRRWVIYEAAEGWNKEKGVVAIRVNKLLDTDGESSSAGINPLEKITLGGGVRKLSDVAKLKVPIGSTSKEAYNSIAANIESWIEEAIQIRKNYRA